MAVDVTLTTITTGYNLSKLNANFAAIATALADGVSRSGQAPNTMTSALDMNSNSILNLSAPAAPSDAARLVDVTDASASLTTGAAVTTTISDTENFYVGGNVEAALEELGDIKSTGSTTARTASDRWSEIRNVKDFGATGDGSTNDKASFQLAVDAITNGDRAVILVPKPSSTYKLDSVLSLGTRIITWMEAEGVGYSGSSGEAALGGNRIFASYKSDATRPGLIGSWLYGDDSTDGTSTDRPIIRVQRDAAHTGGTTGGSIESSAVNILTNVGANVQNYETSLIVSLVSAGGIAGQNQVGAHIDVRKDAASSATMFGANITARDLTGLVASASGGALIGCEVTLSASLADDNDTRIAIDVVPKKEVAAGATSYYTGMRIRPSDTANRAATIKNGIIIQDGIGGGAVTTGIWINSASTGGEHIKIEAKALSGRIRLGSDLKADGSVIAELFGWGNDSGDAEQDYTSIRSVIVDNTAGTEDARLDLRTVRGGTMTTLLELHGINGVKMFVNGALEQVTQGANDSGGGGFAVLRVPN